MTVVRTPLVFGLSMLAVLVAPAVAFGHTTLVRSDPANRAVLGTPPRVVRLYFDERVRPRPGIRAVRNGGGSVLNGVPRVAGGRELVIPLRAGLPRGDYTVLWRVVSDDGHPIDGITTFGVGEGRSPPRPALTAPSERSPVLIVARWLFFAGILGAAGSSLFKLATPRAAPPPLWLFFVAFLLVFLGGAALVEHTSLATRFGLVVGISIVVAAIGGTVAAVASRFPRFAPAVWLAGLLLLPAPSFAGHALDAGRPRLEVPVDLLHVAAASVWLGGLLSLALGLRGGESRELLVRRFSTLAVASVVILSVTGVVGALGELSSPRQVWDTGYGQLLVAKTAILVVLAAIGWMNRYRLIPALPRSAPRLRRNVLAELALFAGLIVVVAFLTQARPGRDRVVAAAVAHVEADGESLPPADALVLAQDGAKLQVAGRAVSAALAGDRYVLWETAPPVEGGPPALLQRDLRTRRTSTLARDVASQYGLAPASDWVVYATATLPPRLAAVRRQGGRRLLLSRSLVASVASRGDRVAWAEQDSLRQRVVVRNMARGKTWVAADLPRCDGGRCYRIDAVALADRGVVFARGAIGPQSSFIVRRAFSAPRSESIALPHDPQPDLLPSSAGAAYYALGRGWYRWDFGQARPRRTGFPITGSNQPIRYEEGRWFLLTHGRCGDRIAARLPNGRTVPVTTPQQVRAFAGVSADFCVTFAGLSWTGKQAVTNWVVSPPGSAHSHSEEGLTGVIFPSAAE